MNRRFSVITLKENTKDETFDILRETKLFYEQFHKIEIDDEVLRYLVDNVDHYIKNRTFPDKAIDTAGWLKDLLIFNCPIICSTASLCPITWLFNFTLISSKS